MMKGRVALWMWRDTASFQPALVCRPSRCFNSSSKAVAGNLKQRARWPKEPVLPKSKVTEHFSWRKKSWVTKCGLINACQTTSILAWRQTNGRQVKMRLLTWLLSSPGLEVSLSQCCRGGSGRPWSAAPPLFIYLFIHKPMPQAWMI